MHGWSALSNSRDSGADVFRHVHPLSLRHVLERVDGMSGSAEANADARRSCVCHVTSRYSWRKCAAVMCESFHTCSLPNIPTRPCRVAVKSPLPSGGDTLNFLGNPCYTSVAGLCADASLGTVSAQTSHDCRGLVCVWWRPWVSGRAAPRPQYNYCTSSEETVVVDREWLQAMSSRIHRHKTLWSHCKHSLMKHPEMRIASRVHGEDR